MWVEESRLGWGGYGRGFGGFCCRTSNTLLSIFNTLEHASALRGVCVKWNWNWYWKQQQRLQLKFSSVQFSSARPGPPVLLERWCKVVWVTRAATALPLAVVYQPAAGNSPLSVHFTRLLSSYYLLSCVFLFAQRPSPPSYHLSVLLGGWAKYYSIKTGVCLAQSRWFCCSARIYNSNSGTILYPTSSSIGFPLAKPSPAVCPTGNWTFVHELIYNIIINLEPILIEL